MSKKGLFMDMITGVQSMILLVVIMVLFGMVFIFLSSDSTLHENKYFSPEDLRLINYLKTPIVIDNQETTLGDFIISANSDLEKRRILRSEIRKVISPYPKTGIENRIKIIFPDSDYWNVGEIGDRQIISGPYITNIELKEDEILQISSIGLPTSNLKQINISLFEDPNKRTTVEGIPKSNNPEFIISSSGVPLRELTETAPLGEILEDTFGDKWVNVGFAELGLLEEKSPVWMSEGYFCNTKIFDGNVVNQLGKVLCVDYPNFPLEFDFNKNPININILNQNGICNPDLNGCCLRSRIKSSEVLPSGDIPGQLSINFHPFNIDPEYAALSEDLPITTPSRYNCAAYSVYPTLIEHIKKFGNEFNLRKPIIFKSQEEQNKFILTYKEDIDDKLRLNLLWIGTKIITLDNKEWIYLGENKWLDSSIDDCNFIKYDLTKLQDNKYVGYCDDKLIQDFINNNLAKSINFEQFKEIYYHE